MTPEQIIEAHIKNNNLDTTKEQMIAEVNAFDKLKNAFVTKVNNCMFLFQVNGQTVLMYIINGGNGVGYVKAIKEFVVNMRKAKISHLQMYVQDTNSAKKLAESAGAISVDFKKDPKRAVDPYLMTMEI